jgi:hypothetical protein
MVNSAISSDAFVLGEKRVEFHLKHFNQQHFIRDIFSSFISLIDYAIHFFYFSILSNSYAAYHNWMFRPDVAWGSERVEILVALNFTSILNFLECFIPMGPTICGQCQRGDGLRIGLHCLCSDPAHWLTGFRLDALNKISKGEASEW